MQISRTDQVTFTPVQGKELESNRWKNIDVFVLVKVPKKSGGDTQILYGVASVVVNYLIQKT